MGNLWHVKNWFRVGKNISWKLNFHTLFGFLYLSKPTEFFYREAERKHKFVLEYLKKELGYVIDEFKDYPEVKPCQNTSNTHNIWTLWWQGEEDAPPLVKACIKSIHDNANGAKVTVINEHNYKDYVDIPDYIMEKRKKGWISFAQLSDILRFLLLERHGGLWLDSTIYVSSPIPSSYFDYPFFSQHTHWQKTCFVQHNLYHGFSIASMAQAKLASFAKTMFLEYWKTHDTLIDYLMIDYILMLAYDSFPDTRQEIDSLPYSSERLYDLVNMLDKPYDEQYFNELKNECIFSKLNWHKKYKENCKGQETFYTAITSGIH